MYKVKLEKFEGPLDLLLDLIEKEKMDITHVSLSKVTDDYLKYLESSEEINPSILADFLHVAAQLILIKSRNLLPEINLGTDEEVSAAELQERLMEYKKYKDLSLKIQELYGKTISFEQKFSLQKIDAFYPGKTLDLKNMELVLTELLGRFEKLEVLEKKTIKKAVSIKEKIVYIKSLILKQAKFKFHDLIKNKKSKTETIVSFLALLELAKQHFLNIQQDKIFGDIMVDNKSNVNYKN
ncbi:MAG: segregation/condensation protein A [Patescibacteria group bacterium]|nr:segregation/condensation protein A [Patescibacteria group bacterium]